MFMLLSVVGMWIGFAIAVAVAANTRGRDSAGWFFLSLLISPLIAGLIVLALPSLAATAVENAARPFIPEAVMDGIPYRVMRDGRVEAMLPGGRAVFQNRDHLAAAARGGTVDYHLSPDVLRDFPDELNGYRYRVEKRGAVVVMTASGDEIKYPNWKTFWAAAHDGR